MTNSVLKTCYCVLIVLLSSAGVCSADSLVSKVDRQTIGKDETLQLTVRYSGSNQRGEPNFASLEKQFEVLSTSKSNHMQSVNGRFTSHTDWVLILLPKEEGKLIIPSFQHAGQVSDALEITVSKPQEAPKGTLKDVFLETIIDQDSVYVQQQLIVKYRLYYAVNLESVETEPLELENVLKEQLPESRYSRNIKNKRYSIAEFSYALFPQTSGEVTIPSLTWDIKIPKSNRNQRYFGFSGRYEISRQRTDAKTITVKPRPDAFPKDKPWIPATTITLTETWSKSPENFNVGEPSTRTISLNAKGLMASQLPQIWGGHEGDAIKSYADKPELDDEKTDTGINSSRIESAAVVVTQNGSSTLPSIRIPWWNVDTDTLQYAELSEQVLRASGEKPSTSVLDNVPVQRDGEHIDSEEFSYLKKQLRTWQLVSIALMLLIAFLLLLLFKKGKTSANTHGLLLTETNEKMAYAKLKKACNTNTPHDIRVALLEWAKYRWPNSNVKNLSDVASKISDTDFKQETLNIDAALYSKGTHITVDGKSMLAKIQRCVQEKSKNDPTENLQSFYAQ